MQIKASIMGADSGGDGGRVPPVLNSDGDVSPEIAIFTDIFFKVTNKSIFRDFQNKVAEIRGKIRIWG